MSSQSALAVEPGALPVTQRRTKFFLGISVVLLLIVLVGFAPTFYLRPFFDLAAIPAYLYVHGLFLTGWFVLLVIQPYLVAVRRTDLHRRLGMVVGLALGAGTLITGTYATLNWVPRLVVRFMDRDDPWSLVVSRVSPQVWYNFGSLLAFTVFVLSAVVMRHRPEAHKRLILLASISIIGPALGRIWRWPIFQGVSELAFGNGFFVLFLVALVLYDFRSRKRLHAATLIGGGFRLLTVIGATMVGRSELGRAVLNEVSRAVANQ